MRKLILSLTLSILLISIGIGVLAQDDQIPSAGILPDSPFYFLKNWKEQIQLFFTFGAENKAKQFLHLADVRLAEYQKMIEKGKTEIAEKTLAKYERQLSQAIEKTEETKEKGKDVEKLVTLIIEKTLKHQEVLLETFEEAPEQAQEGLKKAIEVSQNCFEKAIEIVTGEKKEELERKAEEIKIQLGEKGGTGLACWDLNGDGTKDPDEDINGDGIVDDLDCKGVKEPEESGLAGEIGSAGEPGLACWDLNGDGTKDPDEDINGDGKWDILDCAGEIGEEEISSNQKPIIIGFTLSQLHKTYEETPHRYKITLNASDPDNNLPLTYQWSINCGYFVGGTNTNIVEWNYNTPGECINAKVTVTVTDSLGATESLTNYSLF